MAGIVLSFTVLNVFPLGDIRRVLSGFCENMHHNSIAEHADLDLNFV